MDALSAFQKSHEIFQLANVPRSGLFGLPHLWSRPKQQVRFGLERLRHGGSLSQHEGVKVRKDGRRIQVSLTLPPIKDSQGTVRGISCIARDISDQKQAEQRLAIQYSVTRVLAESRMLKEAAPRLLEAIYGRPPGTSGCSGVSIMKTMPAVRRILAPADDQR